MRVSSVLLLVMLLASCGGDAPKTESASLPSQPASDSARAEPGELRRDMLPRIVFLGDSLTAGLGLSSDQSFPALIGKKLKDKGLGYDVINAGVSGDTSAGGLRRLDWSLEGDVRVLILALGANDGLRGLPIDDMKKNLAAVLDRARARGIPVILAGMEAPPNNGIDYTTAFRAVYTDLATQYPVRFIPFLLQGVAGDGSLNQGDGIHPNIRGAEIIADLVWAELEPMVQRPN